MTTAQVVETSVTVNNNSPIQDYVHPDDQTQPFEMTPGFKPFTVLPNCVDKLSVRSFADDTSLFYSSDNLKQLESVMNQELKQIYNYCLHIKHNKCLRTIFFVHPRESAAPYFKLLTILKLDNICKLTHSLLEILPKNGF